MEVANGTADLHLHTVASDGDVFSTGPDLPGGRTRARNYRDPGHDTIPDGLSEPRHPDRGIEVIAGVEVRGGVSGKKVELLGYFVDPTDDRLTDLLTQVRQYRRERNQEIVDELDVATEETITCEGLREQADGMVGRPHVASALVENGVVDSIGEAFDDYLGHEGEAFVPMERIPAPELIDVIHEAGGVASLAHPGRLRTDAVEDIVKTLVENGLDAIEVPYSYDETHADGYADVGVAEAASLADDFDLLRTGGSDCHGPDSGKFRIGDVRVEADRVEELRDAAANGQVR